MLTNGKCLVAFEVTRRLNKPEANPDKSFVIFMHVLVGTCMCALNLKFSNDRSMHFILFVQHATALFD